MNSGADPKGRLADVVDCCRHVLLHLCLPIQWLNECLSKADWKDMRQCGQGFLSLFDIMACFYQVNSQLSSPLLLFLFPFFFTLLPLSFSY